MAMTLRLTDEEAALLREQAAREHRSMQEVARLAILDRVHGSARAAEVRASLARIIDRDSELIARLAE
ncbi:MAG: DNA-binding protein [Acidimicrobiales bacterium]